MTEIKTHKIRWFWVWDDDREENWLRDMSNRGLHLQSARFPGIYTFVKGEKKDFIYRLDFTPSMKVTPEYLYLFQDAGWEYLGKLNSWQYFRIEASQKTTGEIYSDNVSKVERYKRMIWFLTVFLPLLIVSLINMIGLAHNPIAVVLLIIILLLMACYCYGIFRLYRRLQELKKV
jgi:hypothetical protein